MNRTFLLLAIGAITFLVLLLANNPDLFNDIWLYLIGLMGGILKLFSVLMQKIKSFGDDLAKSSPEKKKEPPSPLLPAK